MPAKHTRTNFGEFPFGDITKIEAQNIPDFDILLAGFPCQAFSIIGKKEMAFSKSKLYDKTAIRLHYKRGE